MSMVANRTRTGDETQPSDNAATDEQAATQEATAQAQQATAQAQRASADAQQASADAEEASADAERAERGAKEAEAGAEEALEGADQAAQEAIGNALQADSLLLDEQAQKLAAQAGEERPLGLPGRPGNRRGLVRVGFLVTFGALTAVALAAAIVALEQALVLLVVAAFIAIGLEPGVSWLVRHGLRRGLAVLIVSVLALGAIASFVAAAVPPIVTEVSHLVNHAPDYLRQLQDKNSSIGHLNARFHLEEKLRAAADKKLSVDSVSGLFNIGTAIVSFTFEVVIVIVLTIYFLAEFPNIKRLLYRLAPLPRRPRVGLLGDEIIARTGGYILGNLLSSLIAVISQYIILRALGVPYALLLSLFVGLLDLVPLVGSTIAGALVTVITLATVSLTAAVINIVFTVAYRLVEDYLINPRILKRTVDVRPVVTIVAVLLGGTLFGIIGALIAVPVAAAVQLMLTEVVFPRTDTAGTDLPADAAPDNVAAAQR
jgi:predicted PurR-regulated permease PerM